MSTSPTWIRRKNSRNRLRGTWQTSASSGACDRFFSTAATSCQCRQTCMQEVGKLNTLNLQGLLRAALNIPPSGKNHDAATFLLAVMEFISDGEYDVSHPATVKAAREHFDQALVKDLAFAARTTV